MNTELATSAATLLSYTPQWSLRNKRGGKVKKGKRGREMARRGGGRKEEGRVEEFYSKKMVIALFEMQHNLSVLLDWRLGPTPFLLK